MKIEFDKQFEKTIDEISKPQKVKLEELLNDQFISSNTDFKTFDDFITNLNISTVEDFQNLPEEKLDKLIKNHSSFDTWQDLLEQASSEYLISKFEL